MWDLESTDVQGKEIGEGANLSVRSVYMVVKDKTAHLWSGEVDRLSCLAVVSGYTRAVSSVAWNPVVSMEFVTGSKDGSVRVWRISSAEAGDVSVRMLWGSQIGRLCAVGLTFKGAVGLSLLSHKLLVQRGAVDESLSLREEGSGVGDIEQEK